MKRISVNLSERQRLILAHLQKMRAEKQRSPTLREIGQALGIRSVSLVDYYLGQLEQDGYIRRTKLSPRRVEITICEPSPGEVRGGSKPARGEIVIIPIIGVIQGGRLYLHS